MVSDYALSADAMPRLITWFRANQGSFRPASAPVPSAAVESHPDTMRRFLAHLRETFGGAAGIVSQSGLPASVADRIRELLLALGAADAVVFAPADVTCGWDIRPCSSVSAPR